MNNVFCTFSFHFVIVVVVVVTVVGVLVLVLVLVVFVVFVVIIVVVCFVVVFLFLFLLLSKKEHEAESFRAGDRVIAIYPNTTSFYSSTVVVAPRQSAARVTVKFDDDEDESGTIPEHRIARRYVSCGVA
jgi:Ca2+/Na+ antiporter